jgi:hypothetical protein
MVAKKLTLIMVCALLLGTHGNDALALDKDEADLVATNEVDGTAAAAGEEQALDKTAAAANPPASANRSPRAIAPPFGGWPSRRPASPSQ